MVEMKAEFRAFSCAGKGILRLKMQNELSKVIVNKQKRRKETITRDENKKINGLREDDEKERRKERIAIMETYRK